MDLTSCLEDIELKQRFFFGRYEAQNPKTHSEGAGIP